VPPFASARAGTGGWCSFAARHQLRAQRRISAERRITRRTRVIGRHQLCYPQGVLPAELSNNTAVSDVAVQQPSLDD
jgi:predicted pyridoxine 5'-phosphate oxidase superfamily flavin-nucleotide-binding protein